MGLSFLPTIMNTSDMMNRMWRLGITGGIGSGKTNVCNQLRAQGVASIDADLLGHKVYEPGTPAYRQLVQVFGQGIVNDDPTKTINRRALGGIVFADKSRMKSLTDIVWPEIARLAQEEFTRLEKDGVKLVVLEAAVLVEAGWNKLMDEVWVTSVPKEIAKTRIMERNGLTEAQALERINSQISNEEREKVANKVIYTDRPLSETNEIVFQHLKELKTRLLLE